MILMNNYLDEVKSKLKKQIEIEELIIVDNSYKHKSHKFFSPEKFHLHLKIKSFYLKSISRVNAQKLIMKILKEDLKSKIHALEITIER
jgi:stress-induced morphogen